MKALAVWIQFFISATLVIIGGYFLGRKGKELAERRGLTELWIGFIFLAAVTSIPELATSVGAVLIADAPALALTDILGSNAFNLFIIAFLNIYSGRQALTARLSFKPFRLLFLLVLFMTTAALGSMVLAEGGITIAWGHTDLASWVILLLYLGGSWKLFREEHPGGKPFPKKEPEKIPETTGATPAFYSRILVCCLLVVGGGFWLARTGRDLAVITGWGESFVGGLFLAAITSLPEFVVCLSAVKIGATEMALGNILGSNIFNLGIIFWTDLAYGKGSLLVGVEPSVYLAGGLGIVLLGIVAIALKLKPRRFIFLLSWDTAMIAATYLLGIYILFRFSAA